MRRAILVALATGLCITSAAALTAGGAGAPAPSAKSEVHPVLTQQAARAQQRARIEERYQADKLRCTDLTGYRREKCVVQAHAVRGRALLEAAAPYGVRLD